MSDDTTAERTDDESFEFDNAPDAGGDGERNLFGRVGEALNRRSFMSNTAKVGVGATVLGAAGTGTAAAKHADASYSDSDYEDANEFGYGALNDVQIVKFALLLERLEATFYTEAVGNAPVGKMGEAGDDNGGMLGEHDVERSDIAAQFANPSRRYSTFQRFQQIRDHEQAHVEALEGVLEEVGEDPSFASDVEFEFPYDDVAGFVGLGQVLEDTGAGAYTGAAPAVDTEEYLAAAAQIHGVENRHASYLRVLNSPMPAGSGALNPFPEAFQPRLSVSEVVSRAEPLVVGADAEDIVALLG